MLLYLMASPDLSSGLQHNSIRLGILDSIRDKDYSHSLRIMCYRMVYHEVSVFYSSGSSTLSLQRLSIVVMKENSAPVQIFYDYELNSLADQLFPTSSRLHERSTLKKKPRCRWIIITDYEPTQNTITSGSQSEIIITRHLSLYGFYFLVFIFPLQVSSFIFHPL